MSSFLKGGVIDQWCRFREPGDWAGPWGSLANQRRAQVTVELGVSSGLGVGGDTVLLVSVFGALPKVTF